MVQVDHNYTDIYKIYLGKYQLELGENYDDKITSIIKKEAYESYRAYDDLPEPITSDISVFSRNWVTNHLERELHKLTVRKLDSNKPKDSYEKALSRLFEYLTPQIINEINKRLHSHPVSERQKFWDELKIPVDEVETHFRNVIKERNKMAVNKNFSSYIEYSMYLNNITENSLNQFLVNVKKIVSKTHNIIENHGLTVQIGNILQRPCYICTLPDFDIKLTDTFELVSKNLQVLKRFKNKITVTYGENTYMLYIPETDSFDITIDSYYNSRHQFFQLVHEYSHVAGYIYDLNSKSIPILNGKYHAEKTAFQFELDTLSSISQSILVASLGEIFITLHRVLFELEIYRNPDTKYSVLYADFFNKVFQKNIQEKNPHYLLDERILFKPLSTLPHVIAKSEVINNL